MSERESTNDKIRAIKLQPILNRLDFVFCEDETDTYLHHLNILNTIAESQISRLDKRYTNIADQLNRCTLILNKYAEVFKIIRSEIDILEKALFTFHSSFIRELEDDLINYEGLSSAKSGLIYNLNASSVFISRGLKVGVTNQFNEEYTIDFDKRGVLDTIDYEGIDTTKLSWDETDTINTESMGVFIKDVNRYKDALIKFIVLAYRSEILDLFREKNKDQLTSTDGIVIVSKSMLLSRDLTSLSELTWQGYKDFRAVEADLWHRLYKFIGSKLYDASDYPSQYTKHGFHEFFKSKIENIKNQSFKSPLNIARDLWLLLEDVLTEDIPSRLNVKDLNELNDHLDYEEDLLEFDSIKNLLEILSKDSIESDIKKLRGLKNV